MNDLDHPKKVRELYEKLVRSFINDEHMRELAERFIAKTKSKLRVIQTKFDSPEQLYFEHPYIFFEALEEKEINRFYPMFKSKIAEMREGQIFYIFNCEKVLENGTQSMLEGKII